MPSYRKQDNWRDLSLPFMCENETCNQYFVPTEDIRQRYCSKACSVSQASRRKKRRQEIELDRQERELLSRPLVKINPRSVIKLIDPIEQFIVQEIKEMLMDKRSYLVVYNGHDATYLIVFRDDDDSANQFYVDLDFPPFETKAAAHRVVAALNGVPT